ncbi:MAG: hypothetical protein U0P45_07535 [Acidimicrobiales bacterium]
MTDGAMTDGVAGRSDEVADALAALADGAAELAAMQQAVEQARLELARAREHLEQTAAPARLLRSVLAHLLPEIGRPALLVDGDLWVVSCNAPAAERLGQPVADAAGTPLARWPHALELGRIVRRALDAPAGPVDDDGPGPIVAVSLGLNDEALPPSQRHVLLLLAG